MIRNYFKVALRSLLKSKFYSFINVIGLAVGLACCLLIVLFVRDELTYDQHFTDKERIYRTVMESQFGGNHFHLAFCPAPMAEAFENDYPEVEVATRMRTQGTFLVKRTQENFKEENVVFADADFFQVFDRPFLHGDPSTALEKPNTLVLTAARAKHYFGDEDPINQTLILDNEEEYLVTGVFEEFPANSHFHVDFILAMEGLEESKNQVWLSNNFLTYFKLREGSDIDALEAKMPDLVRKYMGPQIERFLGGTMEQFEADGQYLQYHFQKLTDIHLFSDLQFELEPNSDISYVYLFGAIAFFILLIACINFVNLSTARSANRAREVGVRKVVGSLRQQLISQFLSESFIVTFTASIFAIVFTSLILPAFNDLSSKNLSLPFQSPVFYIFYLSAVIFIGVLAGLYPAFFLSGFQPIQVLKGKLSAGVKGKNLRSALVVFQFVTTVILIVGTIVVQRQLQFIQNKKLGFDKDQVILLQDAYALDTNIEPFKDQILGKAGVVNASYTSFLPVSASSRGSSAYWPGSTATQDNAVTLENWAVDHEYIPTLGMNIVEGRNFSVDFPSDSLGVILNQAAVKAFGFQNPIGEKVGQFNPDLSGNPSDGPPPMRTYTVIGVVENFHYESLRENISPLGLFMGEGASFLAIRVNTAKFTTIIEEIEQQWKSMAPGQPFSYRFLDDQFNAMYRSEQRIGQIFGAFAILAIIVACLGLFALAAFTAEQRTKEISIRKVLGASISQIVFLLTKEFGRLVIVSIVVAVPLSWYFMNQWLSSFAFKTNLGVEIFVGAGLLALVVAWLTMSYQSVQAARTNPATSLKAES